VSHAYFPVIANSGKTIVSRKFEFSGDYFKQVATLTSDHLQWKSIWVCLSRETSNDVLFVNARRNSLTIDLSGTLRHLTELDGQRDERSTYPGDVCQIPAGAQTRFAWETVGHEQTSIMIEMDKEFFSVHCPEIVSGSFLAGHMMPQNYKPNHTLTHLATLLARELETGKGRGRLFAESAIRLLAIEIANSCWTRKPLSPRADKNTDPRITKVLDYIECHFSENISLQDMVDVGNLNATQLILLFKRATGRTPYAYVVHRRIQEAVSKLRQGQSSISQIALEAGFYDQQQMTHAFKRHLGSTPKSIQRDNIVRWEPGE
jgi:AraC family transcriptional regulator